MMPQGAKDSRSHACMEERLPLAPASHEEEARRADSEWAGISKKSQGASSVVRGHPISPPPEEGALQRATSKWGLRKVERGHSHPPAPQKKEPCKGRLPNGGFGKWREATPIPPAPRGRSPAKGDFQMGASESGERPFPSPRPQRKEPCKGRLPNGGFGKRREATPIPTCIFIDHGKITSHRNPVFSRIGR